MATRFEIPDGFYNARPTCCGLTVSKNGYDQFAIEVAIEIDPDSESVTLTRFGGLDTNTDVHGGCPLEYTMRDAEACGCDTSRDIREWDVDTTRTIRVKVTNDEHGPKFKIYSGNGGLIRKQAMDDSRAAAVATKLNGHIAALRAKNGLPPVSPRPVQRSNGSARQAPASEGTSFRGEPAADDYSPFD
jgi:hypothetical protein